MLSLLSSPQRIYKDFDQVDRRYNILLIDPPWTYRVHVNDNNGTRNANHFYPTMTNSDIIKLPIGKISAPDCALFLWVTNPNLLLLNDIFKSWDFEFKTVAFVWVKTYKSGKIWCGLGHYSRSGSESCFLATRGHPKVVNHSVKQVIIAPYTKHSEKPPEIRDRIVQLYGDVSRIELFARRADDPKWDYMGNELV